MKREIIIFFTNIIIILSLTGATINFAPYFSSAITDFESQILKLAKPYPQIKEASSIISQIISEEDGNNSNTPQEESEDVMHRVEKEDGSNNTDLTQTPKDISKLMAEAEKTIKSEKIKGKTSEESYTGGGTIVSFKNVEIQNKIPTSFYNLDIENLLKEKAKLEIKDISKPSILIYHSHTTESFSILDVGYYTKSADLRSDDVERNMVRVGDEICKILENKGFNVVHDRNIYDKDYNAAYDLSRKAVQDWLEKEPSIEITIDVHRDSITYKNGTKVKPTAKINGKKAARMMIISGCEYGKVKNFPDWESNLHFSSAVTSRTNEMYPGLMRPILFSERKYNMDLTKNSFLLEVGSDANTIDEACYSGRLFGNALGDLLLDEYVVK